MRIAFCLLVLFAVANAGVLKKPGTKKSDSCNLDRVGRIVAKGFQRLYCEELRVNGGLKKKRFLRNYFAAHKTSKGFLPRSALKKELRQSLPKAAMWARKRLLKLRRECAKQFKQQLGRKNNKVSRREFVRYFKPLIKRKKCLKIKGFKFGPRNGGNSNSGSSGSSSGASSGSSSGASSGSSSGASSGSSSGSSKPCNLVRVARVIAKGFQRLYCWRLASRPGLKKKRFLRDYFAQYKTRRNFLPRRALRKTLRQSLPNKSQALRKRLLGLRAKCVKEFKRSLSKDGDVRVTRQDFVRYFKPKMTRKFCKRYNDGNGSSNSGSSSSGSSNSGSSSNNSPSSHCTSGSSSSGSSSSGSSSSGSSSSGSSASNGNGPKKCNLASVAKVITRGFQKLYCVRLAARPGLRKKRFLRDYFAQYKTKKNFLPRRALRKTLRQSLPQKSQKLRKRLLALRARCVKEFKRSLSKDRDVRVTRKDFVQFFKPRMTRKACK